MVFIRRLTNVSIEKGDKEKRVKQWKRKNQKRHEREKEGMARERKESSRNTLTGSPTVAGGGSRVARDGSPPESFVFSQ